MVRVSGCMKSLMAAVLVGFGALAPAQAAGPLEKTIYMTGPRYSGYVPTCEYALSTIAVRFTQKESQFWASSLQILSFENVRGRVYRVPFIDASGTFKYGSGDRSLVYFEAGGVAAPNIHEYHYLVLSDGNTDRSQSHILKYRSFDTDGGITFADLARGTASSTFRTSSIPGVLGEADLLAG